MIMMTLGRVGITRRVLYFYLSKATGKTLETSLVVGYEPRLVEIEREKLCGSSRSQNTDSADSGVGSFSWQTGRESAGEGVGGEGGGGGGGGNVTKFTESGANNYSEGKKIIPYIRVTTQLVAVSRQKSINNQLSLKSFYTRKIPSRHESCRTGSRVSRAGPGDTGAGVFIIHIGPQCCIINTQ